MLQVYPGQSPRPSAVALVAHEASRDHDFRQLIHAMPADRSLAVFCRRCLEAMGAGPELVAAVGRELAGIDQHTTSEG